MIIYHRKVLISDWGMPTQSKFRCRPLDKERIARLGQDPDQKLLVDRQEQNRPARNNKKGHQMDLILLIVTFAFLGYGIKYIDQAYDENEFPIRSANIVAIISGILMGTLMAFDSPFSTAFFIAMIISLVLAKKIDNVAFAAGSIIAFGMMGLFMLNTSVTFLILPIAVFLFAGFVDELVDGFAHKHHLGDKAEKFCHYRPFSDFALIAMISVGMFSWIYVVPYFTFTIAYMLVGKINLMDIPMGIRQVIIRAARFRP